MKNAVDACCPTRCRANRYPWVKEVRRRIPSERQELDNVRKGHADEFGGDPDANENNHCNLPASPLRRVPSLLLRPSEQSLSPLPDQLRLGKCDLIYFGRDPIRLGAPIFELFVQFSTAYGSFFESAHVIGPSNTAVRMANLVVSLFGGAFFSTQFCQLWVR
ncbi:hypothetical protein IVB12_23420 [Bradyrhizobium sp. 179]|uniref:hypothetical protein n=1 Tax=Bradyrhizobium sp. 179 TaxID=2782648 RepID=UPI001FF74E26|nr:hypothetical protein [Bradyrhizobium sp. 179]MCK1544811.1 hypothetical protein [Bradyrhizobium sp. 179]